MLAPADIKRCQAERWHRLLLEVSRTNVFYQQHWRNAAPLLEQALVSQAPALASVPFVTKADFALDQRNHPPFGSNLTFPIDHYVRCHQTSGTSGQSIRWLDTQASWSAMVDQWVEVLQAAGVCSSDRVYCAFSFGPFLGFWLAFEAAARLGCLCIPGGGLSSSTRVRSILETGASILCCTPTYALRLAEVAQAEGLDLARSQVRVIVVAGESGGSVPSTRQTIQERWPGAKVFDHHGMTEVGPVTYQCPVTPGRLHVLESAYLAEIIDPSTLQPVPAGQVGELVLTTLNRSASPAIRYRTGDLVRAVPQTDSTSPTACACGRFELALDGGILGRCDEMVVVRGVNVYPSTVEAIVRVEPDVLEYRVRFERVMAMLELILEIEPQPACGAPTLLAERLQVRFKDQLGLRIRVECVAPGSLPRFEMKAKRWIVSCP